MRLEDLTTAQFEHNVEYFGQNDKPGVVNQILGGRESFSDLVRYNYEAGEVSFGVEAVVEAIGALDLPSPGLELEERELLTHENLQKLRLGDEERLRWFKRFMKGIPVGVVLGVGAGAGYVLRGLQPELVESLEYLSLSEAGGFVEKVPETLSAMILVGGTTVTGLSLFAWRCYNQIAKHVEPEINRAYYRLRDRAEEADGFVELYKALEEKRLV